MKDLDFYMSTSDNSFNDNAYELYLEFTTWQEVYKLRTEITYPLLMKSIHEIYFYIMDNPNKPFACVEVANDIVNANGFTKKECLFFLDTVGYFLVNSDKSDKVDKPFMLLFNARQNIESYLDESLLKQDDFFSKYTFKEILNRVSVLDTPEDKIKYLYDVVYDIKNLPSNLEKHYKMFISEAKILEKCENEIKRYELHMQLNKTNVIEAKENKKQLLLPSNENKADPGLESLFIKEFSKELMTFLIDEYSGAQPKDITIMLYALFTLGYIRHPRKQNKAKLHRLMKNTFGEIGTVQAYKYQIKALDSAPPDEEHEIESTMLRIKNNGG